MSYLTNRIFEAAPDSIMSFTELSASTELTEADSAKVYTVRGASETVTITLPEDPSVGWYMLFFHTQNGRTVNISLQGSDTFDPSHTIWGASSGGFALRVAYSGGNLWTSNTFGPWTPGS